MESECKINHLIERKKQNDFFFINYLLQKVKYDIKCLNAWRRDKKKDVKKLAADGAIYIFKKAR